MSTHPQWEIRNADSRGFCRGSVYSEADTSYKEAYSSSATAMKDVNTKPGEEQSPPAAPSVIRDERRWERREQKGGEKRSPAVASELHKRRGKFASL